MKRLLFPALLLSASFAMAQSPQLTVKGPDAPLVRMSQLLVNVKIAGNIAYTTAEMHFTNKSNRQMEAELLFPLPEGVSVSRYAIDINGKMREAVPVNKSKGKQVFEAIEHRRVDPGLLEKVEGNNFKTRIYPLPPNGGERIVLIGYEEELSNFDAQNLQYSLVSKYGSRLDKFEVNITVLGAAGIPTLINEDRNNRVENLNWVAAQQATIRKTDYQPAENFVLKIPVRADAPAILTQSEGGEHYFYGSMMVSGSSKAKNAPASIGIVWDVSLSCKNRNLAKELAVLDAYFSRVKNTTVTLYTLSYYLERKETYKVINGEWANLKNALQQQTYDGGTRYSQINFPEVLFKQNDKNAAGRTSTFFPAQEEYLFFTDGLSTLSSASLPKISRPVYTITSNVSSDFGFLSNLSTQTGGSFVNLNKLTTAKALNKLVYQPLRFLGIKDNYAVTDLYPMAGTPVQGNFSAAGISLKGINDVTLIFGYGNKPSLEKKIQINASKKNTDAINIEKLWAQKKLASLELETAKNSEEIEVMGRRYGIITPNTSLIVLENINDYLAYDIQPPAELRTQYDALVKQQGDARIAAQQNNWQNVDGYFAQLNDWWSRNIRFTGTKNAPNPKPGSSVAPPPPPHMPRSNQMMVDERSPRGESESKVSADTKSVAEPVWRSESTQQSGNNAIRRDKTASTGMDEDLARATSTTINRKETPMDDETGLELKWKKIPNDANNWSTSRAYLKAIASAPAQQRYARYLQLRDEQEGNPTYYFDVANYFYTIGDRKTALLILSNIADLGLENHQLYKTLTYTLRQWAAYDDAVYTAGQVVKWRKHEPQSHRDYALALEDIGKYQASFDELVAGLQVNYYGEMSGQYAGVEDIILMDLNRIVQEHPEIKIGKLDKKYLKKMPVAMRVILNWNQMDTDLDLHITEPTGEECYYAHRDTEAGARFSKDFTQGYGPEQYLLRNALKGKYRITTNYFGETKLTESGPATVMVEIYTRNATGKTERQLKTIQLGTVKENGALAEVVF